MRHGGAVVDCDWWLADAARKGFVASINYPGYRLSLTRFVMATDCLLTRSARGCRLFKCSPFHFDHNEYRICKQALYVNIDILYTICEGEERYDVAMAISAFKTGGQVGKIFEDMV